MLVKVGDVWVDPLRVEGIVPFADDVVEIVMVQYDDRKQYPYRATGITPDEAARIVNRCREQHVRDEAWK